MGIQQKQKKCRECGRKTLHARETFGDGMGCLLTVLTAGLFFPIWGLIMLGDLFKPYRCQQCGRAK